MFVKVVFVKFLNVVKEFKVIVIVYIVNCKGCSGKIVIGIDLKKNLN